ncbi:Ribokinase-like protein [Yarrowia lipolytica]|uniref:Ribokinase n=1 Tax=Yarrowia lipolytica TaxID=4952 RepID=A0A371C0L2_YARLL|nr:Ribokinase [Yarrowia lipolytica]RDW23851.1 Ribokinase-like protein [Yarrowia lipolytica]RDW30659.1 Ribokinase-like protein [Yarrowia lipolytica]RDW37566.1 Ribokinase-like protein [Yarrowia lipolytica]RDW47920.1 Ribokinase-like protein [Yarrowia lipolytica]
MQITIVGSLNYDLVTISNRLPNAGETMFSQGFETHCGGKGANQALATARLSSKVPDVNVKMYGKVGKDNFGTQLKNNLEDSGVDVSAIHELDTKSGVAVIFVDQDSGENRIMVYAGANGEWTEADLTDDLFDTDMLIFQNEIPIDIVYKAIEKAGSKKPKVVYNPSPVDERGNIPAAVLNSIDFLVVNVTEATLISGVEINEEASKEEIWKQADQAADTLFKMGIKEAVVVTLGGNGVIYKTKTDSGHVPSNKVEKIVDTTGAGDTFLGGFSTSIIQGKTVSEAIAFGNKAGGIAVTRRGAAEGIPYDHEL